MNKPDIEEEINQIRLQLYEETKDLTYEERTKRSNELGKRLAEQYGFKIATPADRKRLNG